MKTTLPTTLAIVAKAAQTKLGDIITVKSSFGDIQCKVQAFHPTKGYWVNYCGGSTMQAVWSWGNKGFVFTGE